MKESDKCLTEKLDKQAEECDQLEEESKELTVKCTQIEDKCDEKIMHADHLEVEMINCFRKIKKHKKWIKAVENRFEAMRSDSSESDARDCG